MVIASLLCLHASGQAHQWQDLHKVKRGETLFGIAKEYNVTIQQIIDANPEMKAEGYELQKGAWIAVPFARKGDVRREDTPSQSVSKPLKDQLLSSVRPLLPRRRRMVLS
ncbi:LysM domain protein, partial [gut metagenome]